MDFTNHGHSEIISYEKLKSWFSLWNTRIRPKEFALLGGEPLLNKDLINILYLTKEMWPRSNEDTFELVTNGLLIYKWPHLGGILKDTNFRLAISIHGNNSNNEYKKRMKKNLDIVNNWIKEYKLDVSIEASSYNWGRMYKGFGITSEPHEDNDPEKSWNNCLSHQDCFQLHEGNIYKCPPMAYLPLQKKKYGPLLSEKWDPYLKYMPLYPNATDEEIVEFFNRKCESVCGMCPKNVTYFKKNDPLLPVSYWESITNNS
jgi:sulfatase maturation enzyme AslB (radical SAM superfamily)